MAKATVYQNPFAIDYEWIKDCYPDIQCSGTIPGYPQQYNDDLYEDDVLKPAETPNISIDTDQYISYL